MLKFSKTPYMIHAVLKILLRSCWSAGLLTYYRFVSEGVEYKLDTSGVVVGRCILTSH